MILIDSNIFVYAHNVDSVFHKEAKRLVLDALDFKFDGCIFPQILCEFYSIITNPARIEKPLLPESAIAEIKNYWESQAIIKIFPSVRIFTRVIELAKSLKLSRAEIFDCYLVATMEENGVKQIYTKNVEHLKKFDFIELIEPF